MKPGVPGPYSGQIHRPGLAGPAGRWASES